MRRASRALFTTIADGHGGAERVTMTLARALASRPGWEVEVFVLCSKMEPSFTELMLPASVRVRYGPFSDWHASYPLAPFRLMGESYELIFSSFVYLNALLSAMRRLRLLKTDVLALRESTLVFDRFPERARRFDLLYRQYGSEDLLIAQTRQMAERLEEKVPSASRRLTVLPNPVDGDAIRKAAAKGLRSELQIKLAGRLNVLFCGRLADFKRPDVAIEAFKAGLGDIPRAQLVFVGAGELEAQLREMAHTMGLEDRVQFFGYQANPYAVMAQCQYGILTSPREGFPNVVLEMMACGVRKIVITPCTGDLDTLTGVHVTSGFGADEIGGALRQAVDAQADCSAVYAEVVAGRSVNAYLDVLLGERLVSGA